MKRRVAPFFRDIQLCGDKKFLTKRNKMQIQLRLPGEEDPTVHWVKTCSARFVKNSSNGILIFYYSPTSITRLLTFIINLHETCIQCNRVFPFWLCEMQATGANNILRQTPS